MEKVMISIFANAFKVAARHNMYPGNDPHHHKRRPMSTWEQERLEADRRRAAMRNIGMW